MSSLYCRKKIGTMHAICGDPVVCEVSKRHLQYIYRVAYRLVMYSTQHILYILYGIHFIRFVLKVVIAKYHGKVFVIISCLMLLYLT